MPALAVWLIFAAIVFDMFDGYVARKLHAESLHGMQLDSMADLISFGVAPAILIYQIGLGLMEFFPAGGWVAWAAAGFYALCTMWRLAYYNTIALSDTGTKGMFVGLPSPAAAVSVCSVILLLGRIDPDLRLQVIAVLAYALCMGFLMVSRFEYMHAKKIFRAGPIGVRTGLLALIVFSLFQFGVYAFFALVHLYLLSGPIAEVVLKSVAEDEESAVVNTLRKL